MYVLVKGRDALCKVLRRGNRGTADRRGTGGTDPVADVGGAFALQPPPPPALKIYAKPQTNGEFVLLKSRPFMMRKYVV